MKRLICLITLLHFLLLVGCEYRLVEDDNGHEKIITPNGTEYLYSDTSLSCLFGVSYNNLKNTKVGTIQLGDTDTVVSVYLSQDENIIVLGGFALTDHPSLYTKKDYDMPNITKPDMVEALYYIPRSVYNSDWEERQSDKNYFENYRLPIEQSDAIEFADGLSQYMATDTSGYSSNSDRYYGYLIVKYVDLDLYFGYYMWGCEGTGNIQIQGDTYNEDLEMYDYYNVPIEYLSFIPLVKEETRE